MVVHGVPVPPLLAQQLGLGDAPLLHWALRGVYTLPAARRQGIAQAVTAMALTYAADLTASEGKSCLITVLAMKNNASAIGMYQKAGFVLAGEGEEEKGTFCLVLYKPYQT